ncbi:DUF2786 domain-containing protein [Paracoccus sp. (in: a-proteobacteria)]|uniref:DUF7168 domain-containing protein n=1 Tax=Paracoccus sp. TaxID=267 RepID=UPI0026DFF4E7|nr:DUF2786 domain-containing protein [Paracoccus sp. (in: a-proteobacteria)]MDO5647383.1 DUF2786 domain-containing protein [Paracoccus sp. (in: a-proteobacteria)]
MTQSTNIDKIAARIRALRAKANDSAASESEASTAAAMAARLLTQFDLTEADLSEYKTTAAGRQTHRYHEALASCWAGIAALTETKPYKQGLDIHFVGLPHDVEMALFLSSTITAAAKRSWDVVRKATGGAAKERQSYYWGFSSRLNERLKELAQQRHIAKTDTGTAITLRKSDLVAEWFKERGITLHKQRRGQRHADPNAYNAGRKVADGLNLNRPLGQTKNPAESIG